MSMLTCIWIGVNKKHKNTNKHHADVLLGTTSNILKLNTDQTLIVTVPRGEIMNKMEASHACVPT